MRPLDDLLAEAWELYDKFSGEPYVVRPSIPVAYFGDSQAYAKSSVKIVTAALNPSFHEFPESDRFKRFPKARGIEKVGSVPPEQRINLLRQALDAYFGPTAYWDWFDQAFGSVLTGLGASYRPMATSKTPRHTAIHTDFVSPLATREGWGDFSKANRAAAKLLSESGIPFWHRLINALEPDIVLLPIGGDHLRSLSLPKLGNSGSFDALNGKQWTSSSASPMPKHTLEASWTKTGENKDTLVLTGLAGRKPYLNVPQAYQQKIGLTARAVFEAGPNHSWPPLFSFGI